MEATILLLVSIILQTQTNMKQAIFLFFSLVFISSYGQNDSSIIISTPKPPEGIPTKIFYSQKIINAQSAEVLRKGIMAFSITHNFGDIAGSNGGIRNFYGLDHVTDVRIGFQVGLSNKFNLIGSRTRGAYLFPPNSPSQLMEFGAKWQLLQQMDNDRSHPLSVTLFGNIVAATNKSTLKRTNQNDTTATSFDSFSDRLSQAVELMIARKFGKISLQLNPIYIHRNLVQKNFSDVEIDEKNIFAIGAAARIPITDNIIFIMDYFHSFRSQASKDSLNSNLRSNQFKFYDPLGVGLEIVTAGHVFHLNFTNCTEILENRFIPSTYTRWGDGSFRWSFTIVRNFRIFKDKKST